MGKSDYIFGIYFSFILCLDFNYCKKIFLKIQSELLKQNHGGKGFFGAYKDLEFSWLCYKICLFG